jgi:hypothetical protein
VGGHRGKIVFTQPSGAWEKGAHCATLMATRGGVLDPRARGGVLPFIGGQRWQRRFASQVSNMGAGYGGMHGRVRRQREWTSGSMVGAAWPRRARCVAQGEWGKKAVRCKRVPRRGPMDRGRPRREGPAEPRRGDVRRRRALWSARVPETV